MPNGYGSIRKLSGKRRKPFHVQKTVSYSIDESSKKIKQERVTIGYYATRQEALNALAGYNANPYDLNSSRITFEEMYIKWSEQKFPKISKSNINGYKASYNLCCGLYNMRFVDIKLSSLQHIADTCGKNYPTLRKLKALFSQLFRFAVINEVISSDKNFVEYLEIKDAGNPNKTDRSPFLPHEINILWNCIGNNEYIQVILMLIYSGVRVSELLDLKKTDVHLDERWFYVRNSKTDSGIRAVPIADKTLSFFEYWYRKNDCSYLLSNADGNHFNYYNYYTSYWIPLLNELGLGHKPHDTRHTCISMMAAANINPTIIKKIVGHAGSQTLTERVYTHLDISSLLEAINMI